MSTMATGFPAFDEATGGLPAGRDYLLSGPIGTGKTSFGLCFLHEGLRAGESTALVTRRAAKPVLEQGQTLGWDLEGYVRSGRLTVLEYPQELLEQAPVLRDGAAIYKGLQAMLDGNHIRRLVFDPVTPLLTLPGASFQTQRVRPLMQALAGLQATTLYIVDTPEGELFLPGCKDEVFGTLRFEAGRHARTLFIDRIPGAAPRASRLVFDLRPGSGLVECPAAGPADPEFEEPAVTLSATAPDAATAGAAVTPVWDARPVARRSGGAPVRKGARRWLVLVAGPDAQQRHSLRAAVESDASVIEAHGPAECFRLLAAEPPDLVLLSQQSRGVTALEFIRKLRSTGTMLPVVLVGGRLRRISDGVRSLEAGADLTLPWPVDLRLLRLHVRHLLSRTGPAGAGATEVSAGFDIAPRPDRPALISTTSLEQFSDRLRAESAYALAGNLSFVVVTIHSPGGADAAEEVASLASFVSRQDDLTYSGERGAAVILAEASTAEPFLERFQLRWHAGPRPFTECRYFDGSRTFTEETVNELVASLGSRGGSPEPDSLLAALSVRLHSAAASTGNGKAHEKTGAAPANFTAHAAAATATGDGEHMETPGPALQ